MSNAYRQLLATLGDIAKTLASQPLSDERVHTARKSIKKARACLRLLREALGEARYERENAALRDAGRCLAPLRNAKSLADAFSAFRERYPAKLRRIDFATLSRHFDANVSMKRRQLERSGALQTARESCAACRARVIAWKKGTRRARRLRAGLQRVYRAGRNRFAEARRAQTPAALHEWRKQVKYLVNALEILDDSSAHMKKIKKRTGKLADQLGEDHDLVQLASCVSSYPKAEIATPAQNAVVQRIKRRRRTLQKRAYTLGAKVYDEKPARFVARLKEA